jgi:esterase/lipase
MYVYIHIYIGKRVIISGHSLGGSLALLLALDIIINHHNDSTKNSNYDSENKKYRNAKNAKNENNKNENKKSKIKSNVKLNRKVDKKENSMKEFKEEKNKNIVRKKISGLSIILKKYSNILKMIFGNIKIFDFVFSKIKKSVRKPPSMFDNLHVVTFGKNVRKWIMCIHFYMYMNTQIYLYIL